MTYLKIEICKNYRGSFNIRTGDIEGASESYNLTKAEILNELKRMLDGLDSISTKEDNINKKILQDIHDNIAEDNPDWQWKNSKSTESVINSDKLEGEQGGNK